MVGNDKKNKKDESQKENIRSRTNRQCLRLLSGEGSNNKDSLFLDFFL